ncbi:hypothetical protein VTN31DRAFT_4335 [Thermomyces dupontii]|uniref:uncharacterized protein n=1 Tax=Talaromyces thermophilus TaxID=28565 RepID=UPI00374337E1
MPPYIPRKRSLSPQARQERLPKRLATQPEVEEASESSDDSSDAWSSSDESHEQTAVKSRENENSENDEDEDDIDWEDAMETSPSKGVSSGATPVQDLELTLDPTSGVPTMSLLDSKKGPSKIEREIRINTHRVHVQCLLFHNALRNAWMNDKKLHEILLSQLPEGIKKEVKRWRVASALEPPPPEEVLDKKSKKKKRKERRDWGDGATHAEPGQPDMSRGDPILSLLRILAAYWKNNFKITAPGLRKHGYRPLHVVDELVSSFKNGEHNPELHGERIQNREELRSLAEKRQGSRDLGAQLFTALLRALGIEARLVSNLQPLGFGWTKAEVDTSDKKQSQKSDNTSLSSEDDDDGGSSVKQSKRAKYDWDLPFPIYWTEAVSPITHEVIPVDPLVLSNSVATTPEHVAAFEPRGARAEKAKQIIAYVVAHSADGTAKDVTTRYLRRRTWPGKTKGFRLPVERVTRTSAGNRTSTFEYDWFRMTMRGYMRPDDKRTAVDDVEDAKDLVPNQPERKVAKKEGDTLQSLRASTEFVLERFLRRDEALLPGAKPVRTFVSGRGANAKEENVYRRSDVVKCMSAESWHKEGRRPKPGEQPLKRVPIRAVTLMRQREVDEVERETGERPLQGLYARYQTEWIIPPPIVNGVIPKNEYGNIDCFVPSMVPKGAVHIPYSGTARICKKLGIDYAEAVVGFEFGSKMAVPVIQGVVVAEENGGLVLDAWRAEQRAKREKERLQKEKQILQTWRKFIMGLRIMQRVQAEYGMDGDAETHNPFARPAQPSRAAQRRPQEHDEESDHDQYEVDQGGGFLLPGEDDDDGRDLIVERHDVTQRNTTSSKGDHPEAPASQAEVLPDGDETTRQSSRRRRRGQ